MDIDAATRRLPEFIKTLRINRAARRESVYAADNVYALLDALDTAEARVRELEEELADQRTISKYNREQAEKAERALAEARKALEPFADIAGEPWADESGWTDAACQNDRICDWFGPSAFLAARRAYEGVNADG